MPIPSARTAKPPVRRTAPHALWQSLDDFDPYPMYRRLQDQTPVFEDRTEDVFVVTHHADVEAVLMDPRFVPSLGDTFLLDHDDTAAGQLRARYDEWMVFSSGRNHSLQRQVFSGRSFMDHSRAAAEIALDRTAKQVNWPNGSVDVFSDFVKPLVLNYVIELLGCADNRLGPLEALSEQLLAPLNGETAHAAIAEAMEAIQYVETMLHSHAAPHEGGVLATVNGPLRSGEISTSQAVASVSQIIAGAIEPVKYAFSNSIVALLENPDEMEKLRAGSVSMDQAVSELLRYDTPFHYVPRVSETDTVIRDVAIPGNTRVMCMLAAANHDPRKFEAPDRLRLERKPTRIASFGLGPHSCLGIRAARTLLACGLTYFMEKIRGRTVRLERTERVQSIGLSGYNAVSITLSHSTGKTAPQINGS